MRHFKTAIIVFLTALLVIFVPKVSGWFSSAPVVVGMTVEQPTEWVVLFGNPDSPNKLKAKATHAKVVANGMDTCVEFSTNGRVTGAVCDLLAFGKPEE